MEESSKYKISAILSGHRGDVKGTASVDEDTIVTVSRDGTGIIWVRKGNRMFEAEKTLVGHEGYVNSVAVLKDPIYGDKGNRGYILTGGMDKMVYVWDISDVEEPKYALVGHKENVCTIAGLHGGKGVVTGSWDKTARVWHNWECIHTLEGHEGAVWAVLELDDGTILTGSADKVIRRWKDGNCIQKYVGHDDCVRGLMKVGGETESFLSVSNDGAVIKWRIVDGYIEDKMVGHESFIYSMAVTSTGEIVTAGEDRTVRVWKNGENIETLIMPVTTIWSVAVMSNDDIVCGASDAMGYVFSRSKERQADVEVEEQLKKKNAEFAVAKKTMEKLDMSKIPGVERLEYPGTKDQQVIMVKKEGKVEAYQWTVDGESQEWVKVGDVTDVAEQQQKQEYEGKQYDYVFSIDIGGGTGEGQEHLLKLPYNTTENPYMAAQKFIERNNLDQNYLEEIAMFIIKNSDQGQGQGQAQNQDQSVGSNDGSIFNPYAQPIDGGAGAAVGTGGVNKEYKFIKSANLDSVFKRIAELASKNGIENTNLGVLEQICKKLGGTIPTSSLSRDDVEQVIYTAAMWPVEHRYPILDLLRLIAGRPENRFIVDYCKANQLGLVKFMEQTFQAEHDLIRQTMMFRFLANLYSTEEARQCVEQNRQDLEQEIVAKYSSVVSNNKDKNKALENSYNAFYYNFSL